MSHWLVIRSARLPVSFRLNRRVPGLLLTLAILILAAMLVSVGYGEYPVWEHPTFDKIVNWRADHSGKHSVDSTWD